MRVPIIAAPIRSDRPLALRRVPAAVHGQARILALVPAALAVAVSDPSAGIAQEESGGDLVSLPAPRTTSSVSVETALLHRRSIRRYADGGLSLEALGQLLWAAQGITRHAPRPPGFEWEWRGGLRTAPSAGALYPLEVHAVVGRVDGLRPGVYRYVPVEHALRLEAAGDLRSTLAAAALGQTSVGSAAASLVLTAVPARSAAKYGERAERYVHMEVGAAGQNVYLQCEALGLATVFVGAFRDQDVGDVLELPPDEHALAILPIGQRPGE